ncbi:MAG: hypothetical protein LBR55_07520, partial [Bacteroidales bacterium]|nr:hypothetical protein [Bacteroidales bacterium]
MNQILKKLKHLTFSYFYIYSVVIVVFTIIIACYVFMSNLEREHLRFEVNNEISYVQNDIVRDFHEHEVALTNIAEVILRKIKYGESADTIREYLQSISNSKLFSHNSENHKIIDLQGFFEVFGDKPPTDEPWYKKAIEAKGNVAFIEPVWDFALNMIVVAYAINILDENGKSLGSLYLKLDFNNIIERVCNMQTINNGWGILLNSKLIVIAHKNRDFISHHIDSINIGIRVFSNDFKQKTEFSEQEMINYLNEKAITFFKLIDNDLYLGVVM